MILYECKIDQWKGICIAKFSYKFWKQSVPKNITHYKLNTHILMYNIRYLLNVLFEISLKPILPDLKTIKAKVYISFWSTHLRRKISRKEKMNPHFHQFTYRYNK